MPTPSDLVHETATTTGSGNFTVSSVNGKRTFNTAFGTGGSNVFDYFISNRDAAEWERETFRACSVALGVSYSRSLTDRFSIGGTFRYIRETIYNSSASGIAFDVGTIFETPFEGLKFAAVMSNFGDEMQLSGDDLLVQKDIPPQAGNNPNIDANLSTDRFDIPLNLRIGFSYELLNSASQSVILALDATYPNDNTENLCIGAEYSALNDLISLRAGYRGLGAEDSEESFTAGGGMACFRMPPMAYMAI